MKPLQAILFVGALFWGVAMKMGYDKLIANPETTNRQVGYATLFYYGFIALSLVGMFMLGEGALIGYLVGILFIGNYRSERRPRRS